MTTTSLPVLDAIQGLNRRVVDTVLLLRYFETEGEIRQAISVLKKRTGGHERTLRQLQITENGLLIGDPLRAFRGIMTGVPQYENTTSPSPNQGNG